MALSQKDRQQLMVLLIIIAVGGAAAFWMLWRTSKVEEMVQWRVDVDSLQASIDSARADLAAGTVDQLRQRVDGYERTLEEMRKLVPTNTEVTNLIDQVTTRAQVRGVEMIELVPLSPEFAPPFTVERYRFTVDGTYDNIAQLLTDIASLERIMVPYEVGLAAEPNGCSRASEDADTCLRASFQLRTFVKSNMPAAGGENGTP